MVEDEDGCSYKMYNWILAVTRGYCAGCKLKYSLQMGSNKVGRHQTSLYIPFDILIVIIVILIYVYKQSTAL